MVGHPIGATYLDMQVARASAALAGAGAWDATPTVLNCNAFEYATFFVYYTRAAAGGGPNLRLLLYPDAVTYGAAQGSLYAPGVLAAGADVTGAIQREDVTYISTAAGIQGFVYGPVLLGRCIERLSVSAREIGAIGSPGTLLIVAKFG